MRVVSQRELSAMLGVHEEVIVGWVREGMPVAPPLERQEEPQSPERFPRLMRLVNKRQIAEQFGVSEQTISDWHAETPPFPILKQGSGGANNPSVYDIQRCMDWYQARKLRKEGIAPDWFEWRTAWLRDEVDRLERQLLKRIQAEVDREAAAQGAPGGA